MKKLFLLFIVLLTGVTRLWATVSFVEGRPYTIKHSSSSLYVNIETAGQNAKLSATFSVVYFTASGDNWTISNLTNSLYATSWNATANTSNSTPWIIAEVSGKDNTYTLNQQTSYYKGFLGSDQTAEGSPMYCNKSATEFVIEELDNAPTIPLAHEIRVGEKANSFTIASSASDNDHWYLITNRRKKDAGQQTDEAYNTPVYFAGAGNTLKRADTNINPAAITGNPVSTYIKHFVRFVRVGDGKYNLQFANGAFVNASLQGTYLQSEAGTYLFYNTTTEGTGFGWNLDDDSKKIVDNNGQGAALAFWESGTVTATSGNNVWSIYPVTFETGINVTYNLYESDGITFVESQTVEQLTNSEVSIPTAISSNTYFDYVTVGTIGAQDCTIKVIRTLKNSDIVYPTSNLSNNKSYYIYTRNKARGGLSTYTDEGNTYLAISIKDGLDVNPKKFAIISYEDNYYLYSVDDAQFVTYDGNDNKKAALANTITGTTDRITFHATTAPLYQIHFDDNDNKIFNGSNSDEYPYGMIYNSWGTSSSQLDDGCQYTIEEADDFNPTDALAVLENYFYPSYTVTYVVRDVEGNPLFTSDPVGTTNGAKITTLPTEYQRSLFYTYNTVDVTISSSGNTNVEFTATLKDDAPVKYTADTSNPYYYNLNIRSKYMVYSSGATGEVTLQNNSEPFNEDASWAFIGEPYAGFKVINKKKGTDSFLTYTEVTTSRPSGNNIQFIADADFSNQYWIIDTNNNGIVLRIKENTDIYFHHDNGGNYLRTCSKSEYASVHNDPGSTIVASTDEDVLIALYNNMKDWSFGTSIGQMNTTDASVITNEVATSTISSIEAAILAEQTSAYPLCYNSLMTIKDYMSLVKPTAGFYRLKNVATGKYLTAVSGPQAYYSTTRGVYASNSDGNSAASIIRLYAGNDGLYMYNQGNGFGWVVAGAEQGAGVGYLSTNPDKYVNWFPGKAANHIAFAICYGNGIDSWASYLEKGIYMVDTSDEAVIGGTDYKADAAQWIMEEATSVTISMNSDGAATPTYYATFCAPFSYTVSDGTKAYTLEQSGEWLVPTEIEGEVAAGTPVLLKGSSATATLTIGSGYVGSPLTDTALTGIYLPTTINTTIGSGNYVFGKKDSNVGFYHVNNENCSLKANRAYLSLGNDFDTSVGCRIMFDDVVTGIVSIFGETEEGAAIYNISGQRLNKIQKGINIVNGKKVLF